MSLHYVDTSALGKLVIAERETAALFEWLRRPGPEVISCDLTRTGDSRPDPPLARRSQLAVALSLGDELRSVLTYDQRMRDAAVAFACVRILLGGLSAADRAGR